MNFYQNIVIFLLGWFTSLGTTWYMQHLKNKAEKRKRKKQKKAFAALFISLIDSLEVYLKHFPETPWNLKLWYESQLKFAEFFPEETVLFASLLRLLEFSSKSLQRERVPELLLGLRELRNKHQQDSKITAPSNTPAQSQQ